MREVLTLEKSHSYDQIALSRMQPVARIGVLLTARGRTGLVLLRPDGMVNSMRRIFAALCFVALLAMAALASDSNGKFMPVSEIKPGMKGYGMSVFQGATPERFEVEILGT